MTKNEAREAGKKGVGISVRNAYRCLCISPRETADGLLVAIYAGSVDDRFGLLITSGRPTWGIEELEFGENFISATKEEADTILAYRDGLGLE